MTDHREVEMDWMEAQEQERRLADIEKKLELLERHLLSLARKVYDVPVGTSINFLDGTENSE